MFEREYPQWPWRLWGGLEPDKAKLEMAVHRVEERKRRETQLNWERCGWCRERREMLLVAGSEVKTRTGRIRFEVRCVECGMTSLRSRHPNPVVPPGLEAACF